MSTDGSVPVRDYDPSWWRALCEAWSSSASKHELAGLGTVRFAIVDQDVPDAWIEWDDTGTARARVPATTRARFAATTDTWSQFISGRLGAAKGVLSGQITFHGELKLILPYIDAFDRLAEIADQLPVVRSGSTD